MVKHTVVTDGGQLEDLLRHQPGGGGEATLHERHLVDVIVLRAREHEVVGEQPNGSSLLFRKVRLEHRADDVVAGHATSPAGVRSGGG